MRYAAQEKSPDTVNTGTLLPSYRISGHCTILAVTSKNVPSDICLFVLRFYGPVNPMGLCRARSVYLTTRLLGRLSPLSG